MPPRRRELLLGASALLGLSVLSACAKPQASQDILVSFSDLSQPFFVATQFTGLEGKYVPLEQTIAAFEEILSGKYDDLPEQAFYLVGNLDDVKAKAKKLAGG